MAVPVVHLITDRRVDPDPAARLRATLSGLGPGGVRGRVAVHLREKDLGGAALMAAARRLGAACRETGALLLVNDRADVALAAEADGVHLPAAGLPPEDARRLLGPGALVGVSCHSAEDVRRALLGGADFATFGPVFDTPSKRAYGPPVGLAALREAARLGLPLVGLGGVDPGSAPRVMESGARGVAVQRGWLAGTDPGVTVRALLASVAGPAMT